MKADTKPRGEMPNRGRLIFALYSRFNRSTGKKFLADSSCTPTDRDWIPVGMAARGCAEVPGVPGGMGAVLFLSQGEPDFLECFTYADTWDGSFDGFRIISR